MLQIVIWIVAAGLAIPICRSVGATVAAKGHDGGFGYQLIAVVAYLGGGVTGAVVGTIAVAVLSGREAEGLGVLLIVNFFSLAGGVAGAGAVMWWVSQLSPTKVVARRTKEAAEFNPFDDGQATPTKHDSPPNPTGHDI